jgi:hypothetical protein
MTTRWIAGTTHRRVLQEIDRRFALEPRMGLDTVRDAILTVLPSVTQNYTSDDIDRMTRRIFARWHHDMGFTHGEIADMLAA